MPPVAGNAEAGVQQPVVEIRGAELVRPERADVVVVAETEREVERDERGRGVGRRARRRLIRMHEAREAALRARALEIDVLERRLRVRRAAGAGRRTAG